MKKSEINLLLNVLLISSIYFAVVGFLQDMENSANYGGIDLRNRVVGARLIKANYDPYFFKWNENYSELFLDSKDYPNLPVSRVTVPPTILLIHSLFSDLPYKIQRYLWTIIQWFLILFSIFFFTRSVKNKIKIKLIWIISLFFIADSFIFRLHVERGQIYILYVFLFALSYYIYGLNIKFNRLLSGVIIGYSSVLRFPMVLIGLPFLICKRWKFVIGQIIGVVLGILTSFLFVDYEIWRGYFKAMSIHSKIHLGIIEINTMRYPHIDIEDMRDLWIWARLPITDSSIQGIVKKYLGIQISTNILLISLIISIMLLIILFLRIKKQYENYNFIFLSSILIILVSELFLPAARFSYSNVILLPIFSLIIINSEEVLSLLKK
ncbi:MAG: DUF2029 domain-containing protein [Candidatus Cloacimonetes bacterium]|nr:DUF2029 domain-containing protein [Candidatus Cloacimonadota bacterium]